MVVKRLCRRLIQGLRQIPGLSSQDQRKVFIFLGLACSILLLNVVNYTIASALFLQHLGTVSLPISYIIIGCLTLPLYGAFAKVVDIYPRSQLLKWMLLLIACTALSIRLGLIWKIKALYFVLYISAYFLWGLLQELFTSLAYDYFTVLEVKQFFPRWGVGMALGEVLAALLTAALAWHLETDDLLLILPILCGFVLAPLHLIQTQFAPIAAPEPEAAQEAVSFQESVNSLGRLGKRYWIIPFLVSSALLHAVLYCLGEFLYFQIYVDTFTTEQALTQFLAMMRGVNNVLQIFLLTLVTQPLLQTVKIGWLNLAHPLFNLLVFAGLRWRFSLPTAMAVNTYNDAFYEGLDKPVFTINYNAVPYRYLGRIQSLVGVFDALGLVLAGMLLALPLAPLRLTELALGLSGLFVLVRYGLGKGYSRSMMALLQTDVLEVKVVAAAKTTAVRARSRSGQKTIEQLLSADASEESLPTTIAQLYDCLQPDYAALSETLVWLHRLPNADAYRLLKSAIADFHQRLIQQVMYCLNRLGDEQMRQVLLPHFEAGDPRLQANALEILLASPYQPLVAPLMPLLSPTPEAYPALSTSAIIQATRQAEDSWIRLAAQILTDRPEAQSIYKVRTLQLKQQPLLATLSLNQIYTFAADFKIHTYPVETVFVLVEPALFLIDSGQCVVQASNLPPALQTDSVKHHWLIKAGDRLTLQATQSTTVLQLPEDRWNALIERYPELQNRL